MQVLNLIAIPLRFHLSLFAYNPICMCTFAKGANPLASFFYVVHLIIASHGLYFTIECLNWEVYRAKQRIGRDLPRLTEM
jgi:hypothetical protein